MNSKLSKWAVLYPVHYLRNERLAHCLRQVELVEAMTPEDINMFHRRALSNMVRIAAKEYEHVHDFFKVSENELMDISLFHKIPFLTKEIIGARIKEKSFNPLFFDQRSTSGTTGTPFVFYKDHLATGYMEAVQRYAFSWYGIPVGAPHAMFWGTKSGRHKFLDWLKDVLKNRKRFSAFSLTKEEVLAFSCALSRFDPQYFYGYTSVLSEFIDFFISENISFDFLQQLKVAVCTGEFVPKEILDKISTALNRPCANEYGCGEVGVIGFTCPVGNMHVMQSNIYLEVVDSSGDLVVDQEGDIVVTELHAKRLPFLRYKTGDRGILLSDSCSCGKSSKIFRVCAGRIVDFILAPDGKKISSRIFKYILKKGIKKFKAIQRSPDRIDLYCIVDGDYNEALSGYYLKELSKVLGKDILIDIFIVDEIPRQLSGKFRDFNREF